MTGAHRQWCREASVDSQSLELYEDEAVLESTFPLRWK